MTLEQIRASLPTHIMLTSGVHRWREGDKVPLHNGNFIAVCSEDIGSRPDCLSVREIPPHILDNQAWWLWYQQFANIKIASSHSMQNAVQIDERIEEGRLYDKWLREQMEGV